MLKKFLPHQKGFFDLFQKTGELLVSSASEFHNMLTDLPNIEHYVQTISSYEKEGDNLAHATFELLHKTFITPFDRNDIHELTSGLDDILDRINRCAQRFPFYQLTCVPNDVVTMAKLTIQATVSLKDAIYLLHQLSNANQILQLCNQINQTENTAETALLAGMAQLYQQENDFKQFIKTKEIYEYTKSVINDCEDVANIIKGIVLEYS